MNLEFPNLPKGGLDLGAAVNDLKAKWIIEALERSGHNKNRAARLLRVKRTTLLAWLKKRRPDLVNEPFVEL